MKMLLWFVVLFLYTLNGYSQVSHSGKTNIALKPVFSDCDSAIKIPFGKKALYGPTVAPKGFGKKQEIKSENKNDLHFFEKEHNSAWYYFDIPFDGQLVLEIVPEKNDDDYDFLLFKWTDANFCDDIKKKKIIPVRTNLARTGRGNSGLTGLSRTANGEFIHSGIGSAYTSPVTVKKGERFYLVLDNVYPNGGGHTIKLAYEKEVHISGTVHDENQKPLKAEITVENSYGNEIGRTESDSTGHYKLTTWLWTSEHYTLITFNDSSFLDAREISQEKLEKEKYNLNDIKIILPKLKGGKKYELGAINFFGDQAIVLTESNSSMNALGKLMKKNKKMIVRIEGHVNNPTHESEESYCQDLSERRAKTVYDFLLSNGINKERISTIGFGDKHMLFPKAKSDEEQKKNRRVEINVISVK